MELKKISEIINGRTKGQLSPAFQLMIHRTGQEAAEKIAKQGLETNIDRYGMLESIATIHSSPDGKDFTDALTTQHMNSTHHLVVAIPEKAVKKFESITSHVQITTNKLPNVMAEAMGGTIPPQWIIGTYHHATGNFTLNPQYNPNYAPKYSKLKEALTRFKPKQ